MANYKKLTDVEIMEEVSENTMALVDENGTLKKVPCGAGFGGGGVATAIIRQDGYDNALAGVASASEGVEVTFTCVNMTFDEAYQIIMSGEPLWVVFEVVNNGMPSFVVAYNVVCDVSLSLIYAEASGDIYVYWTADGVSTEAPSGGGK